MKRTSSAAIQLINQSGLTTPNDSQLERQALKSRVNQGNLADKWLEIALKEAIIHEESN